MSTVTSARLSCNLHPDEYTKAIIEEARIVRPRVTTPIHRYTRQHLQSVNNPDDWQQISRTLVGTKHKIRDRRKVCEEEPVEIEQTSSSSDEGTEDHGFHESETETIAGDFDWKEIEDNMTTTPGRTPAVTPAPPDLLNSSCSTYLDACHSLNICPSSRVLRQLAVDKELIMKNSVLGPRGAKACALALLGCISVTKVHFCNNNFGSIGGIYMVEMLEENMFITDLELSENQLGSQTLHELCMVLLKTQSIKRLCLSGNNFDEFDAKPLSELIKSTTSIESLDISHNCFRETGGITIADALVHNHTIERLNLSWNHLRMKGAIAIAESLMRNAILKTLNIAWNGFHMGGCKTLAKMLKCNNTLTELDLTCNRIDIPCLTELLVGLKKNSSLTCLRIGSNPITTKGAISLLKMLRERPSIAIQELDLRGQSVDNTFIQLMTELKHDRPDLKIKHGILLSNDNDADGDDDFVKDDPMMVLMEFMRLQNLRLVDLFTSLDKDGSRSLSYEEFRNGLLSVNIPMSVEGINRLIRKLDEDGDGEVDFSELIAGQREHKKRLHKLNKKQSHMDWEDTELGRISIKIRALIALQRSSRNKSNKEGKNDK